MAISSLREETAKKVLRQVEFYFSDSNLPRDDFLKKSVTSSKDGMVSLAMICSFSRMRTYLGLGYSKARDVPDNIVKAVAETLRNSEFLKVSEDGKKVGRVNKLSKPEEVIGQVDVRSIAASPLEYDVKLDDVGAFFGQYSKVNSVRLPPHVGDEKYFCGTALIEFSTEGDAEKVLKQNLVYAGIGLELKPKKEFDAERTDLVKDYTKYRPSTSSNDKNNASYHKGLLVAFKLKKRSTGGSGEHNSFSKAASNSAGVIKTGEGLKFKENAVEESKQRVSEDDVEGKDIPLENPETEVSEHKAYKDVMDGQGNHVKNTEKEICEKDEENSAKGSKEKDSKNSFSEVGTQSPAIAIQENKERITNTVNKEKVKVLIQDLKDVFQRFGTVKLVDYSMGADSGYICFEEPEAALKARAAADFVNGLIIKNYVAVLESVNAVIPQHLSVGSKEPVVNENAVGHKSSRFRSNLVGSCKLLQTLKMTEGVKEILKATPFWCMLAPILSGEIKKAEMNCDNFGLSKIIQTYSKDAGGFLLGGKFLRLSPSDFKAIFGISGGDKEMVISTDTKNKRSSNDRLSPYVPNGEKLTAALVRTGILVLAGKKGLKKSQEEDMAILVILHLLANFFLPSTVSNVSWGWVPFVTEIKRINEWDWATALCEYMTNYLDSKYRPGVPACHGCVPLLVYAICEHTTVFKPRYPSKFPRYLRWDFHDLQGKVAGMKYSGSQVNDHELVLSDSELKAMDIGSKGSEEDKEDEDEGQDDKEDDEDEEKEKQEGQDNGEEAENQDVVQDDYDEEENDGEVDYNLMSTAELCKDITHACEGNDEEDAGKDAEISALKLEVRSLESELTITNAKTAKLELELTIIKAKTAKLELELVDLKKKFDNHSPTDSIPLNEMMAGLGKRKRPARKASAKKTVNVASRRVTRSKKKTILKELSTLPVDSRWVTRSFKMIEEIEDPVLKKKREEALESLRVAKVRKVEENARNLDVLAEQAARMLDEPVIEAAIIPALNKVDDQEYKSKKN